jgi:hypothetical protein
MSASTDASSTTATVYALIRDGKHAEASRVLVRPPPAAVADAPEAADAVAADGFSSARSAVQALKDADGGRAAIVLADWPAVARQDGGPLPEGALWAIDLIDAPDRLLGALTAMLSRVAVVEDLAAALDLVATRPHLRAVTRDGDLVGAGWVDGGSDRKPSTLEIAGAIEAARTELAAAETRVAELTAALAGALAESEPKKLYAPMPVIYITAVAKGPLKDRVDALGPCYLCPVYRYPARGERYRILSIPLPTKGGATAEAWTLRGVCLLALAL